MTAPIPTKALDLRDLALRAMACKDWRWLPGMAAYPGGSRCTAVCGDVPRFADGHLSDADAMPRFADPLTVQALLLMVREAWAMPHLSPMHDDGWCFWWPGDDDCEDVDQWPIGEGIGKHATEAELFVVALERAP